MRILIHVPNIVLDGRKGDSIHARELSENLSQLGNRVDVICKLERGDYHASTWAVVKRVRAPSVRVVDFLWTTIYGLFLSLAISRKHHYDLIYTRAGFSASAYLLSRLTRVPYITEVNSLIWDDTKIGSASWLGKVHGYFLAFIDGKACRRSQHLIAVTPGIKKALAADLGMELDKITVVPNGANTDLFKPITSDEAKQELHLSGAGYFVAFVGNLVAWQGVEYLIKSIHFVVKEIGETKFLIVGDGPMKQELVELGRQLGVSDEIIFVGRVPYEKVPLYINASHLCVAPFTRARNERCGLSPLKIHEYMACGKPVVASRIANLEHIEQIDAGILVEPENPQELAVAIAKLLKDKALRQQMGENGRKYVVQNHSWGSIARRIAEVCEHVVKVSRE